MMQNVTGSKNGADTILFTPVVTSSKPVTSD